MSLAAPGAREQLWVVPGMMGDVAVTEEQAGPGRPLVGRDGELAELGSRLGVRPSRAVGTGPNVVLLSGDAGVGKTRLLTELGEVARAEGWQVVAGHCVDFGDSALPYLAFSEVLGRLALDQSALVESVASGHPGLVRLQPGRRSLADDTTGGGLNAEPDRAEVDRADLFAAVHALLEAVSGAAPLLVVIEDAHWADQSTRDLISFLCSRPFAGRVGIVVSYRADDLHRRHPLRAKVAEWSRVQGVSRVHLGPLRERHVRAMIAALHTDPITESDVAHIVDRADGNAFFVEELVGATWADGGRVPEDLADLLLVRLDRLDDPARQVVRTMAVAGRRVSHGLLAEVSGLPDAELDRALRSAIEASVLVTSGEETYAFRHALLADAVYDDLLPGERVRLHRAYTRVLAEARAPGTAAELARHARAALDLRTAFEADICAGDEAMSVGGPDEAAHHYELALEVAADPEVVDPSTTSELVLKASEALVSSGALHRAEATVLRHLDVLPDGVPDETVARLHLQVAYAVQLTDSETDWRSHIERATALIPAEDSAERARLLAMLARTMSMHRLPSSREVAMEALAVAEAHHLHRTAADATTTLVGLDRQVPIEQLVVALEEATDRAVATGAGSAELRARFLLGRAYQDRARSSEAAEVFARATDRARELGIPWAPFGFDARLQHAQVAFVTGDWDRVLELTDVDGQAPPALPEALLSAARVPVLAARGESATGRYAGLRDFWTSDGLVAILAGPAQIEEAGRTDGPEAALAVHDDIVRVLASSWGEHFHARIRLGAVGVAALSRAAPEAGREDRRRYVERAERLAEAGQRVLEHRAGQSAFWGPEGRAWSHALDTELLRLRWLADVEPPAAEDLVAAWRSTVEAFEELGHAFETARARLRLAEVLRATGAAAETRELVTAARETAEALDAKPLLDELRALGATPATRSGTSSAEPAALTPREREILTLVATGRSNGEIGRQLFISVKTVSVHVSNILGKLGAASRTEAAAIARSRELI